MAGKPTVVRERPRGRSGTVLHACLSRPRRRQGLSLDPAASRSGPRAGERPGAPVEWPSPRDGRIETPRRRLSRASAFDQAPRTDAPDRLRPLAPHSVRGLSSADCPLSAGATGPVPPTAASTSTSRHEGSGEEHQRESCDDANASIRDVISAAIDASEHTIPFPEIGPRILLVEDERGFANALRFLLEPRGFNLTPVRRSDEALKLLKSSVFDAALIDWKLNGSRLDGLDLLKAIRPKHRGLPIVFITMFDDEDIQTKATRAGADEYLDKRDSSMLPGVLGDLIRRSRSQEEWRVMESILADLGVALSDVAEPIRRALAWLCLHLSDGPRIGDAATAVRLAPKEFRKEFKKALPICPKRFLMRLQVETALRLMHEGRLNNSQIATRVGFRDLDAMYGPFVQILGRTVTDIRREAEAERRKRRGQ